MFETSPTLSAIGPALAQAQGAVEGALKGKENAHFRSNYADLAAVWGACREALSANGLSVVQSPGEVHDGRMGMTTMLLHASGEWMRGYLTIPLGKVDAQSYGSATTYARRYALAAFVGVAPEDDDGNAATAAAPPKSSVKSASAYQAKKEGKGPRCDELIHEIRSCMTMTELGSWSKERADEIKAFPEQWQAMLREEYAHQRGEIEALNASMEAA